MAHSPKDPDGTGRMPATTALNNLASHEGPVGTVRLVVLGRGNPVTYALPSEGEVLVGRSENADVRIDEDSISRRHAILRIGDNLTVEDLGSLNGTRVRDRNLKKSEVAEVIAGEAFELGKVLCIVQRRSGGDKKPARGLRTHSYVESRIEEEIERRAGRTAIDDRSEERAEALALARFHLEGTLPHGILTDALAFALATSDLAAEYGPGELEVLFIDVPLADVEARCEKLARAFGAHAKVGFGIARYPRDGRSASALLEASEAYARGARREAPVSVVHGAMERLRKLVERVAASDISIVLHGETGVGKEVLARELHKSSDRAQKPFVGLNCAALTETLLESELFGHERGAFSGAVATKPGLLEVAEGGTVFLDEVGEMSLGMQAKLLRVLEERMVLRVGGLAPRPIDVRFISASHKDLEEEVDENRFRQDLFFRLNGITLEIPPLRERTDEIEGLARGFLLEACRRQKRLDSPRLGTDALELLKTYAWPGNVRELRNVIERAVLLCTGSSIRSEHLPAERMMAQRRPAPVRAVPLPVRKGGEDGRALEDPPTLDAQKRPVRAARSGDDFDDPLPDTRAHATGPQQAVSLKTAVEEIEREKIVDALRRCAGNQTKAAQMLGISRRTLLNRLDDYGLPRPRK
jgi:two-component system, NtrC family, response regulator AtoC